MEFLHGHDVRDLVRRLARAHEVVPFDQAIAIAIAVCAGLHHAHDRVGADGQPLGIVHRDVSPHNVLVTYDGAVKLIDFGIARATMRMGRTEQGIIKGKPGYMSPEQVRGRGIDRRADVWATAVLLYEMTTGVAPYGEGDVFDVLRATVDQDPVPPEERVAGYPAALAAIIRRGMARDVSLRYPTAEAMGADLEDLARSLRLDLSPSSLAGLMERVFSTQLAAWRTAQREGRSLAEHVAALRTSRGWDAVDVAAIEALEPAAETRPLAVPVSRRRRVWPATAIVIVLAGAVATLIAAVVNAGGPDRTLAPTASGATAPVPAESAAPTPAPAPAATTVSVPAPAVTSVPPTPSASTPRSRPARPRPARRTSSPPSTSTPPPTSPTPTPTTPTVEPPPPPDPDAPLPR